MAAKVLTAAPRIDDLDPAAVLDAMPDPVLVIGRKNDVLYVNLAGESFFGAGAAALRRQRLDDLLSYDSRLLALAEQVRRSETSIAEYAVDLGAPALAPHKVDLQVAPIEGEGGRLLVTLRQRSIAEQIDHQLVSRGAARSVSAMSAVLAHEIRNPLSGIRGAAQLLSSDASDEERGLTTLICEETDRISGLVNQMEAFGQPAPIERSAVNIHQVIDHVLKIARAGFAERVMLKEVYDPSLPDVSGDRDQLIQVFLNLIKNAAEAVDPERGEITVTTAYRHGVRIGSPGSAKRLKLPIEVCVIDNGPGIPEEIAETLFDPFVTTKSEGTGLGLSLAAKIVNDHGGVIEFLNRDQGTVFRILLPAHGEEGESGND